MHINQLNNLERKVYYLPLSVTLVTFACPQSGNPHEHPVLQREEKSLSNI